MTGELSIADNTRTKHNRFRNNTDYETYVNAIDQDYESEDAIFNGYIYRTDTPQVNLFNRSQYGKGRDFKLQIFEFPGNICFKTTNSYCFVKCINILTGEDYKQQYLNFF